MSVAVEPFIDEVLDGVDNPIYRMWLKNNAMFLIDLGVQELGGDLTKIKPEIRQVGLALVAFADSLPDA
jgi:hypothetical protein